MGRLVHRRLTPGSPDGVIDSSDVSFVLGFVGLAPGDTGYDPRLDLVDDGAGVIDGSEVSFLLGFVGTSCVPLTESAILP